jgi:serine/threonine protein kinase
MSLNVTRDAEILPGYRLLEPLGQGGFGEVWKAEAPGGLLKAVKILHGNVQDSVEGPNQIQQELKALNRVRTVRHPYVLSLERFEIIEGRLVIVMELADRSLWDRYQECRTRGWPGIPRDELLRYMDETAEALDLMNDQFHLQHLDIKPQNIFLLYNHVKVGDFGLVKDLEGMWARATSGVTAVYAAPETFEGVVSRYCDQYNLAIAYQELLTGRLPFGGTTGRQLMLQHLTAVPNVEALPPSDRGAVARALTKKPEDRHLSCTDFVLALRRGGESAGAGVRDQGSGVREAEQGSSPLTPDSWPLTLDPEAVTLATQMLRPVARQITPGAADLEMETPAVSPSMKEPPVTTPRGTVRSEERGSEERSRGAPLLTPHSSLLTPSTSPLPRRRSGPRRRARACCCRR